jgi:hypothetical protein
VADGALEAFHVLDEISVLFSTRTWDEINQLLLYPESSRGYVDAWYDVHTSAQLGRGWMNRNAGRETSLCTLVTRLYPF